MRLVRIFLSALVLLSCSQNPVFEVNVNKIIVQAILDPGFERQTIFLGEGINVANIDGLLFEDLDSPLQNATVVVRSSSQEVRFQEISPGVYQDVTNRLNVQAGEIYVLEVNDNVDRSVSARTRVPGTFQFTSPEEQASFRESELVAFDWEPSRGVGVYVLGEIIPECSSKESESRAFNHLRVTRNTQTFIRFRQWDCNAPDRGVMNLRALAVDSSAARWIWPFAIGDGEQTSNIENGIGVFGSMVSDSLKILITN